MDETPHTRAHTLYDGQKEALAGLLDQAVERMLGQNGAVRLADLLHKLAGTAAYFSEAPLGAVAAGLEPVFRAVSPGTNLSAIAALARRRLQASGLEGRHHGEGR